MAIRGRGRRGPAVAAIAAAFPRDVSAGLDIIARHTARARQAGAQPVVFPEAAPGGSPYEHLRPRGRGPTRPPPAPPPARPEGGGPPRTPGPTLLSAGSTPARP